MTQLELPASPPFGKAELRNEVQKPVRPLESLLARQDSLEEVLVQLAKQLIEAL